jgi:MATE family multidrug resistance protein
MEAFRQSFRLAWPLILSNLSVPLLGMVDMGVVGHLPDPAHLGAVALGATVMSVLYFAFGFLRMGTTALTAQAFGAGDTVDVQTALLRGLMVAAALGVVVLLLGWPVILAAERLFAPPPAIAPEFRLYLEIRLFGAPAALATFVVLGWLLGLQSARGPLILLIATNVINAALDMALVFGLGMAADGVALATAIAEYSGLGVGLLLVRPRWRGLGGALPSWPELLRADRFRRLLVVNRDIFMRSLFLEAAFLLFTALGSRQGELVLAANAVLLTFFTMAAYGLDGFAYAAEALVGRTIGARDAAGLKAVVRASFVNAALLAVVITLGFWAVGPWLVRAITDLETVRGVVAVYLPYAVLLPAVAVWAFVFDGIFFGATRTAELRNGMFLALLLFCALVFPMTGLLGNHGLWQAFLIFLAGRGVILGVFYLRAVRGDRLLVPIAG